MMRPSTEPTALRFRHLIPVLTIVMILGVGCTAPNVAGNDPEGTPSTVDAIGTDSTGTLYTPEEQAIVDRLRDADVPTIKDYIRSVLHEDMPPDFELPAALKEAGSAQAAELVFARRYPEFYGKQGPDFIRAIAASPIRYRQLIRETRAVRKFYQRSNN
ncbi:MAG: hypothetical protein H6594_05970 [Flavobacteriales bacterium]|nr:hypothetical protein [Flavobacteriales bacterium]